MSRALLVVLASFLCGYLSASFLDYTSLSSWVSTELLQQPVQKGIKRSPPQQVQLPKPKFEFYTLLANENQGVQPPSPSTPPPAPIAIAPNPTPQPTPLPPSSPQKDPLVSTPIETTAPTKPPSPTPILAREAFFVQVAAFKSEKEATRMKTALVLKGFKVNITQVAQQNVHWYRVNIGPFASKQEAQKAQIAIAQKEHIAGMVRKMDLV